MLKGIDVSNWQAGINIFKLDDIDFVICKASEGDYFVDGECDKVIQDAIALGLCWGFYHFAGEGDAEKEAEFFISNCKNYFGHGIPVLDYENANGAAWCEKWLNKVHELTGIWPVIYMSASKLGEFEGSWVPDYCGLWVAGYPEPITSWTNTDIPYDLGPWGFAALWQFTSSLRLDGYAGNLDGDYAYMDAEGWASYAGSVPVTVAPSKPAYKTADASAVRAVLDGAYGDGDARKAALEAEGYVYQEVQDLVNAYYDRAQECVRGDWGNGWNREQALTGAGYDYQLVQQLVNGMV